MTASNNGIMAAIRDLGVHLNTKIDAVRADVDTLRTEVAAVRTEVAAVRTEVAVVRTEVAAVRTEHGERLDRIEGNLRQVKEMVGVVRLKEVARLDGRIDQLAMDMALSRKAAE